MVTLPPIEVSARIAKLSGTLTVAERRVAQVVLDRPQLVAFGTVAELASESDAGAATVVRLASKLQFDGFTALQASVQHDLAVQLRPAAERIREPATDDLIGRHLQLEMTNIQSSLRAIDTAALDDVVGHLVDGGSRVLVLSGDATRGVASQLAGDLGALRDDVTMLEGTDIAVKRQLALLRPTDVLIALDLRRYERWVVEAAIRAHSAGVWSVAITDSLLSPLAQRAERTFVVSAGGAGPFDSHVGTLAICNVLVAAVADRMRATATERLDRLEAEWQQSFTDG